jgi:hypothetical protein
LHIHSIVDGAYSQITVTQLGDVRP